jgi:hypothetical protein
VIGALNHIVILSEARDLWQAVCGTDAAKHRIGPSARKMRGPQDDKILVVDSLFVLFGFFCFFRSSV